MLTCGKINQLSLFLAIIDLYNYSEFFEKILFKICKVYIKEMVFVLELRHIFGMVIDDDGNPIGVEEELKIFERVLKKIQRDYPLFTYRLIVCGLKILGTEHIVKMCEATQLSSRLSKNLISGFDMVNEEDYTPGILEFVKCIKECQS